MLENATGCRAAHGHRADASSIFLQTCDFLEGSDIQLFKVRIRESTLCDTYFPFKLFFLFFTQLALLWFWSFVWFEQLERFTGQCQPMGRLSEFPYQPPLGQSWPHFPSDRDERIGVCSLSLPRKMAGCNGLPLNRVSFKPSKEKWREGEKGRERQEGRREEKEIMTGKGN